MLQATDKIHSIETALDKANVLRQNGKKIVALSGSFDIIHGGHVAMIEEARHQGDALFIFLNSDESVKKYKGPRKPYMNEIDRARVLAAMESVDGVILFNELNPIDVLTKLKPDVYANGSDWGKDCIERPTVESYGGTLYLITRGAVSQSSSSGIVKKIMDDSGKQIVKAAFIDRDGVIIEDIGYLHEVDKVKILPNVVEGLRRMHDAGYVIIVVTNQSGVGRGKYPIEDMHAVNAYVVEELAKQGVPVREVYYCPHAPDQNCDCRKPKIGLLLRAVEDHGVVLEKSFMVGDKSSDIECGRMANAKAILIENGLYEYDSEILPNHKAKDLLEASQYMI